MQYNHKYFKQLLTKRGWCKIHDNGQEVVFSRDQGGICRALPFFVIIPSHNIVVHYGLGSFVFPERHIRAIKGYVETKYKRSFKHYGGKYEDLDAFLYERGHLTIEELTPYNI